MLLYEKVLKGLAANLVIIEAARKGCQPQIAVCRSKKCDSIKSGKTAMTDGIKKHRPHFDATISHILGERAL